jgi:hypothetical protein
MDPSSSFRRAFAEQMTLSRKLHELGKSLGFGLRDGAALRRQPIVAAAVVIRFVMQGDGQFLDQTVHQHPLNGSVERPGTESGPATGHALDVLHDRVAMRLSPGEHEQDVEYRRCKGGSRFIDSVRMFTSAAMLLHKAYKKWLEARTQSSSRVRS